ncbi:DUF2403 domain-containing lipoprotein [Anaeromyxobacter diazotrophicus]|uniref:Cell wall protein YJL171C/Tos1 N-terminal domain-containing protein n=1 Tax=Anaeromyxobacter diazotrophicus TaxID=2590199 RepID=A0A7I9VMU5_9BACT|nr:hypothetical protein AMYX_24640 [Anaeromyxobacter diazotrophicus]
MFTDSARRASLVALAVLAAGAGCSRRAPHAPSEPTDPGLPPGGLAEGIGPARFAGGELDAASLGGTITFQQIGAAGWYPRVADPAVGPCDVTSTSACCRNTHTVPGDRLTPWDEELILTLRGPMLVKQLAVYQPDPAGVVGWRLVSAWDSRAPAGPQGLAFAGNGTETAGFTGAIGTECLVNVATDLAFACGAGSAPYCPASSGSQRRGWSGSKLFVLLAEMPHAGAAGPGQACSTGTAGGWYDAPWIGLSAAELVRAGSFSPCQCYAKDTSNYGAKADGCGQFNAFEVVNDNNAYRNLGVLSTDLVDYAGYVGEGPCGPQCDVSKLPPDVDLIAKATDTGAAHGALASPTQGPGAAFRRPDRGYRYFLILLDVDSRTVQLGVVHPNAVPAAAAGILPALPATVPHAALQDLLNLRLPQ